MIAQNTTNKHTNLTRSYLYNHDCSDSLTFICQVGCPEAFQRIGNHCYMQSEDFGIPHLTWQEARDYCTSLSVPEGYHADLAILGLPDQDDYLFMDIFVTNAPRQWLGAFLESECHYKWIDGRELSSQSIYWPDLEPFCGVWKSVIISPSSTRPYLATEYETNVYPFICQIFQNDADFHQAKIY
ncbi:unnamed protein product [Meganyctiphanes norvegica]|uniref:C-type lectin domain-containing protein n=1 Tax=Meganyctiphanes norvegica TaxID=48144 RepID=A0AAV2QME2_MEGNR